LFEVQSPLRPLASPSVVVKAYSRGFVEVCYVTPQVSYSSDSHIDFEGYYEKLIRRDDPEHI
jgi:hypothetical protein